MPDPNPPNGTSETTNNNETQSGRALTVLGLFGAGGILVCLLYSRAALPAFALLVVVGAGSAMIGALLGFLFGIPRTLQQNGPPPPPDPNASKTDDNSSPRTDYRANTNLEQISDWLTKILVGVGLTQVAAIGAKFQQATFLIAGGLGDAPSNRPFAAAIIIYYLINGFLFGYLWTRIYLPGAFRLADLLALKTGVKEISLKLREIESQRARDAAALMLTNRQLNPSSDGPPVPQSELDDAIKAASPPMLAQISNLAQFQRAANWRDNKPAMALAIPVFRALIAADEKGTQHQPHGQLGYALKDQSPPDLKGALEELNLAIQIRGGADNGSLLYELNRASCLMDLDPNFKATKPTEQPVRDQIIADLRAVLQYNSMIGFTPGSPEVSWIAVNHISMDDLKK